MSRGRRNVIVLSSESAGGSSVVFWPAALYRSPEIGVAKPLPVTTIVPPGSIASANIGLLSIFGCAVAFTGRRRTSTASAAATDARSSAIGWRLSRAAAVVSSHFVERRAVFHDHPRHCRQLSHSFTAPRTPRAG